jgi:hypothetical protein
MALALLDEFLDTGSRWLVSLNPSIAPWRGETSTFKSLWFISPRRAFSEIIVGGFLFFPMAWFALSRPWSLLRPRASLDSNSTIIARILFAADWIQRIVLALCVVATWVYKSFGVGTLPFLLMPCHIMSHLCFFLSFVPESSEAINQLSFTALLLNWVTWPALLFPDTSDLVLPFEKEHFFIYHWILLTLPACWVLRRRFNIYSGLPPFFAAMSLLLILETHLGTPVAVMSGSNVMYALVPPFPLTLTGEHYRVVMALAVTPGLILVTRFSLVSLCLLLAPKARHPERLTQ